MKSLDVFSEKLGRTIALSGTGGDICLKMNSVTFDTMGSWTDEGWTYGSSWMDEGWTYGSSWSDQGWTYGSSWSDQGWTYGSSWSDGGWSHSK